MKVEPATSTKKAGQKLLGLVAECESMSLASAWVTQSPFFEAVLAARKKLNHFVIGTHGYVTSADCLDACLPLAQVRVVLPMGALFHPKLYVFYLGDQLVVYVGSANLTRNGLSRNVECGVFLTGDRSNPRLQRFVGYIESRSLDAKELDPDFITSYRANKRRVKDAQKALKLYIPLTALRKGTRSANKVAPQTMSWRQFEELVRADPTHGFEKRLELLARARQLFAKGIAFGAMTIVERKKLAGLLDSNDSDGIDWGYFGQMTAFGGYKRAMREHASKFSAALDQIPLIEPVKRVHFDRYLERIMEVPGGSKTWLGMGSRLLAMKRPDQFVCIDGENEQGLCGSFGAPYSTTNLENYWERVVEPMTLMPWWQAPMPLTATSRKIWMGRAALLDAIYYDPDRRKN